MSVKEKIKRIYELDYIIQGCISSLLNTLPCRDNRIDKLDDYYTEQMKLVKEVFIEMKNTNDK